ncbi:MAG: hypothetical protein JXB33_10060 [Clostridia bacterium]|nr:hypothetical protein [Clostridia bacterium]
MKQGPRLEMIQENMKPGAYTAHGFLGDDDRMLKDILREDNSAVERHGISHGEIAAKMRYFTEIGRRFPESTVTDGDFEITVDDHRGFIPCPFADNEKALKTNTRLYNKRTGETVYWSDLNIHMIMSHGFYEGKGSFFRTGPVELAKTLGLID